MTKSDPHYVPLPVASSRLAPPRSSPLPRLPPPFLVTGRCSIQSRLASALPPASCTSANVIVLFLHAVRRSVDSPSTLRSAPPRPPRTTPGPECSLSRGKGFSGAVPIVQAASVLCTRTCGSTCTSPRGPSQPSAVGAPCNAMPFVESVHKILLLAGRYCHVTFFWSDYMFGLK